MSLFVNVSWRALMSIVISKVETYPSSSLYEVELGTAICHWNYTYMFKFPYIKGSIAEAPENSIISY